MRLWRGSQANCRPYGKLFKEGDRVGVVLDMDNGTLSYFLYDCCVGLPNVLLFTASLFVCHSVVAVTFDSVIACGGVRILLSQLFLVFSLC